VLASTDYSTHQKEEVYVVLCTDCTNKEVRVDGKHALRNKDVCQKIDLPIVRGLPEINTTCP